MSSPAGLRPVEPDDLDTLLAWRNHPDIRRYMLNPGEIPPAEHYRWFERTRQEAGRRLLLLSGAGRDLGFVHFSGVAPGGVADWGFYAAPDAPRGTGSQLCRLAVDLAFNDFSLRKICGQVLAFNNASIRLHQRLGFRQEGHLREQHRHGEHYADLLCFGLLQREWHEQQERQTP